MVELPTASRPSRVSYSVGFTRNMGNFESLRIDISVEDEPRGEENTSQAYNRVKDFVESRLFDAVEELESQVLGIREQVRADFEKWRATQKDK